MRPPRLLLLLLCFIALPTFLTFLSLLSAHPQDADTVVAGYGTKSSRLRALFSFHTPASLFPPSATIRLTDDNSTFFLARPAAFGPALPGNGLSGQLWVGSGFGDENLRKTGSALGAEGELGCWDVPGWGDGDKKRDSDESSAKLKKTGKPAAGGRTEKAPDAGNAGHGRMKRTGEVVGTDITILDSSQADLPAENDGTDDHLHHPLPESNPAGHAKPGQPAEHEPTNDRSKMPTHADIQSLQESAEIAGKIVLLSRGGCGFLEKVKWVQRRGGVALIVGDDARGGPLITMYARKDTSNVTIPALFTSHTTAHLLSSLIPPEAPDDQGSESGKDTKSKNPAQKEKDEEEEEEEEEEGPTFTATTSTRPTARPGSLNKDAKTDHSKGTLRIATRGWLGIILSFFGFKGGANYPWYPAEDSRRPPSSGNIDWVLLEDWDQRTSPSKSPDSAFSKSLTSSKGEKASANSKQSKPYSKSGDDFVIGIQDWRDPDVLGTSEKQDASEIPSTGPGSEKDGSNRQPTGWPREAEVLKGGSITPGSGEYEDTTTGRSGASRLKTDRQASYDVPKDLRNDGSANGWLSRLLGTKSPEQGTTGLRKSQAEGVSVSGGKSPSASSPSAKKDSAPGEQAAKEHMGLWVTLTPTRMSSSPFFETLLVLVVSPLVTLTVVYALLLLRSRIRRRRWRAPKSVVDRLPVRIYHTMSGSSSTTSSQITTSTVSSPTSPLLRSTSRTAPSRSRPRSQTTSGVIASVESAADRSSVASSPAKEKASNAAVWRQRYTGRQIECVVCLEEFIDGQSRVMRLPCGHEFHAGCM